MHKYIVCALVLFFSCNTNNKIPEVEPLSEEYYLQQVEKELANGQRFDDIFLTFELGDTKQEVENKFRELAKRKTIRTDSQNKYIYEFSFGGTSDAIAYFLPQYYQNKLYELALRIEMKNRLYDILWLGTFMELCKMLNGKYGLIDYQYNEDKIYEKKWIDGNREIELVGNNGIVLYYRDKEISNKIEHEKKLELESKKTENKNAL